MADTRARGRLGEEFAAGSLARDGYELLARNWRAGRYEIDLIVQKDGVIAFVEVKTRCEDALISPAGSLSKAQRRRIALAAVAYLRQRGIYNTGEFQPRFDLFEIVTDRANSPNITRFTHLAGAFDMGELHAFL